MSQIPKEHFWIECENRDKQFDDSITDFGPITSYLIAGKVRYVLWPKFYSIEDLEQSVKYSVEYEDTKRVIHSKVMSNDEIEFKYGRAKYYDRKDHSI